MVIRFLGEKINFYGWTLKYELHGGQRFHDPTNHHVAGNRDDLRQLCGKH